MVSHKNKINNLYTIVWFSILILLILGGMWFSQCRANNFKSIVKSSWLRGVYDDGELGISGGYQGVDYMHTATYLIS